MRVILCGPENLMTAAIPLPLSCVPNTRLHPDFPCKLKNNLTSAAFPRPSTYPSKLVPLCMSDAGLKTCYSRSSRSTHMASLGRSQSECAAPHKCGQCVGRQWCEAVERDMQGGRGGEGSRGRHASRGTCCWPLIIPLSTPQGILGRLLSTPLFKLLSTPYHTA